MEKHAISVNGVTKCFRLDLWKKRTAVDNLSLTIPQGSVVGLLGPNGSGKSTTLKMIMGFLNPTRGEIRVGGFPSTDRRARHAIGYLPENPRFQRFMTARQILVYYGKLLGLGGSELNLRAQSLLERVGLLHAAEQRVQGFSKGMVQRLAIAQALLNNPTLLVFDEPMSGLDPLGRIEIRTLIAEIHREFPSTTILFSTHVIADVEELCDSVALLKNGRLDTQCGVGELLARESERFNVVVAELPPDLIDEWKVGAPKGRGVTLEIEGVARLVEKLSVLKKRDVVVLNITSHRKKLEQALFSGGRVAL